MTNQDKMLQLVLSNERLWKEYNTSKRRDPSTGLLEDKACPFEESTMKEALRSDNPIVVTIAKIIEGVSSKQGDSAVYKDIISYLKSNI